MKTLIISTHFNSVDYIELQYLSFKKYFKGDYDFVVFNDAKDFKDYTNFEDDSFESKIFNKCEKLNIKCFRVPQEIHTNRKLIFPDITESIQMDACTRCADSVQTAFNYAAKNSNDYEFIFLIDSDMFFVGPFNIEDYMTSYNMSALPQSRGDEKKSFHYIWNGIAIFRTSLPNLHELSWNCGRINDLGGDVGAQTYFYLEKYKEFIKLRPMTNTHVTYKNTIDDYFNVVIERRVNQIGTEDDDFVRSCKKIYKLFLRIAGDDSANKEIMLNTTILHLRAGGNWNYTGLEVISRNLSFIREFLNSDDL